MRFAWLTLAPLTLCACTFLSGFEGLEKGGGGGAQGGAAAGGASASAPITDFTTGLTGSCAIVGDDTGSSAYCWGLYPGASGLGFSATPVKVELPGNALSIVIGAAHRCAFVGERSAEGENLKTDVFCWGDNDHGQLGDGTRNPSLVPVPVSDLDGVIFDRWSTGHAHTCTYELGGGRGYCWGANGSGQIGDGTTVDRLTPYLLPVPDGGATGGGGAGGGGGGGTTSATRWSGISSQGLFHSCAIAETDGGNVLYCWGLNETAQLGQDPDALPFSADPVEVDPPNGVEFDRVFSGGGHTCARGTASDKPVYCWGKNDRGQLGTGDTAPFRAAAERVDIPEINSISIGVEHTCATFGDGPYTARCWGANDVGQIGVGATEQSTTPADLTLKDPFSLLVALKSYHSCYQPDGQDRALFCYGANDVGQLGDGTVGGFSREPRAVRF